MAAPANPQAPSEGGLHCDTGANLTSTPISEPDASPVHLQASIGDKPLTHDRFGGDCERVHRASLGSWPSTEGFHTGRVIVYTRAGQLVASVQAQHFRLGRCADPRPRPGTARCPAHNRFCGDRECVRQDSRLELA